VHGSMAKQTVADQLADIFARAGVKHLYGVVGGGTGAEAQISGSLTACAGSCGPGFRPADPEIDKPLAMSAGMVHLPGP
jgi:hypothetical protein